MGLVLEDPRSPMSWPRRRRSLRRRVAELERLLAELSAKEEAGFGALNKRTARLTVDVADVQGEVAALRAWRAPSLRRFDHEPAVERLLAGEAEAAMRRTGSPT